MAEGGVVRLCEGSLGHKAAKIVWHVHTTLMKGPFYCFKSMSASCRTYLSIPHVFILNKTIGYKGEGKLMVCIIQKSHTPYTFSVLKKKEKIIFQGFPPINQWLTLLNITPSHSAILIKYVLKLTTSCRPWKSTNEELVCRHGYRSKTVL